MAGYSKVNSIFSRNIFKGKCAIITGGGSGIGKGIATELAFLGSNVIIASRDEMKLKSAVEDIQLESNSNNICHFVCDIRNELSIESMVKECLEKFGKIHFLVNNAGGQFPSKIENMSAKGWKSVIDTNLHGPFLMCKSVFSHYMKENGGNIVNIIAGIKKGFPIMGHTGAARAAIENLTKTLSIEWAHYGIRVNSVAPGTIIHESMLNHYGDNFVKIIKNHVKEIPAKRAGTVEEVSSAVLFLLSDAAKFITGETIQVDGGQSLTSLPAPYNIPDHGNCLNYKKPEKNIDSKL